MTVQTYPNTRSVDVLIEAIAARDFNALAGCFHPEVRFRALTPNNTFGHFGAVSAVATVKGWYGDASIIELVSKEIEPIGSERIRLGYRLRVLKDHTWKVVEQQGYCTLGNGLVADISLVCSGFQPVDEIIAPPTMVRNPALA
jgi:hypothetical protein